MYNFYKIIKSKIKWIALNKNKNHLSKDLQSAINTQVVNKQHKLINAQSFNFFHSISCAWHSSFKLKFTYRLGNGSYYPSFPI